MDALEAPPRAIDLKKKQEAEDRTLLDKAKSVNMPNFRPRTTMTLPTQWSFSRDGI
jgi:hypothetical protein